MEQIETTGLAQRRSWDTHVLPPVEKVAPGLWSIPVPIPDNPLRYVLVYVLELDDGIALVDAGWNTDEAFDALTDGLLEAGGSLADVRGVLVTHIHPDHYGLAGRVRQASGAWVALHPADAALLGARYGADTTGLLAAMRDSLADSGVPDDELGRLTEASMGIRQFVELVEPDVLLDDGDRPETPGWELVAVWTPGHSPGHLCFHAPERRLLLTGDHVLPRITPNIAMHVQQRENPLADFLDALAAVRDLDVDEVLPAHEWRFRGLAARADQLRDHHRQRLRQIRELLATRPGATCWELTRQLTWSRSWTEIAPFMRRAATAETLAHLVLLRHDGEVSAEPGPPTRWRPRR